ncbi:MAG: hypothetical protein ACJZZ7_03190 [Cytophagales bacterium]|nr:MAG: hypothetical protein CNE34_03830 [Rhodothermaeota bacterium MED-G18]|tara:strand:- start:1698 stop:3905 length:2208 start_codon:yes stop_codon:yes gene_type:complete
MKKYFFLVFLSFLFCFESKSQRIIDVPFTSDDKISIDGILEQKEWENSEKLSLNFETEPGYNTTPVVETVGFIQYSENFLYVAFHAKTNEPVRAAIRKRDDMGSLGNDLIGISIDTYGDGRNNVFIGSNPLGSQIDVRILNSLTDEGRYDLAYDLEYESIGVIGDNEYYVELKIPFSSISFSNNKIQKWKFSFVRRYLDYAISTSKDDRNNSCITCQLNDFIVLDKFKVDRKFDLLPYISSNLVGNKDDNSESMNYDKIKPNFGVGINAELSKTLSLELTINPDFSQVEADVTKIDANSAYTLSYPEKRPFFNNGVDILKLNSSDLQPFYSRSINDPLYALKMLNQGENSRFLFLSSIDRNSPYLIAGNDQSYFGEGGRSLINILRYQHLLGKGSKIGILSSSRVYKDGGYGNLFGVDGLIQISNNIRFAFDILKNFNLEPNKNWIDSDHYFGERTINLDGEKFNGSGISLGITRKTERWTTYVGYKHIDPNYRADVGFAVKNDRKWITLLQSHNKFWNNGFIKTASFTVKKDILYDFTNNLDVMSLDGSIKTTFKGNTEFSYYYDYDFITNYLGVDYKNYGTSRLGFSTKPIELFNFISNIRFGKDVAFNSDNPEIGKELDLYFNLTFQITDNFSISNIFNKSRLKNLTDNTYYFDGLIYRVDTKYQFSKTVGVRLTSEINTFNNSLFFQPLFEWIPNPFTIFYIGGNQNFFKEKNYDLDNSQVFIKFQYLINL